MLGSISLRFVSFCFLLDGVLAGVECRGEFSDVWVVCPWCPMCLQING